MMFAVIGIIHELTDTGADLLHVFAADLPDHMSHEHFSCVFASPIVVAVLGSRYVQVCAAAALFARTAELSCPIAFFLQR